MKRVVLLSGGMDSAVMAAEAMTDGAHLTALWVDYGQPAAREEGDAARNVSAHLGIVCQGVRMAGLALGDMAGGAMPGSLREVPGRNAILATLGVNQALRVGATSVLLGATADDAPYADCQPAAIAALSEAMRLTWGVTIAAPLLGRTKRELVTDARRLGLPLALTWSCYEPADRLEPCGRCEACRRREVACVSS
jgi:7-cyano-7-deazaguanine synthase